MANNTMNTATADQILVLHRIGRHIVDQGTHVYTIMVYNTDNLPVCEPVKVRMTFLPAFAQEFTEDMLQKMAYYGCEGGSTLTVLRKEDNSDDPMLAGYEGERMTDDTPERIAELLDDNLEKALRGAISNGVYITTRGEDYSKLKDALGICNCALKRLGYEPIDGIDPNGTDVQRACYKCYHPVRRKLLASQRWGFALRRSWTIGDDNPNEEGFYTYRRPTDVVKVIGFKSDVGSYPEQDIEFKVKGDVVYAKRKHGYIEWITDAEYGFSLSFVKAFVKRLVQSIARELKIDLDINI